MQFNHSEIPFTRITKIRKNNNIKYGQECASNWISYTLLEVRPFGNQWQFLINKHSYHMTQQSNA